MRSNGGEGEGEVDTSADVGIKLQTLDDEIKRKKQFGNIGCVVSAVDTSKTHPRQYRYTVQMVFQENGDAKII